MLASLQRLGVIASFSRPSVSDDNSYSESLFVDQIVPSIGADPKTPGGIDPMMTGLDPTVQMIPITHEGRVVGLESNPPGVSVSGAAMTGSTGLAMPDSLLSRIPVEMRDAVMLSIIDHVNREGVTVGSKGIIPGIENVGKNPELARALTDLPPKERQDARHRPAAPASAPQAATPPRSAPSRRTKRKHARSTPTFAPKAMAEAEVAELAGHLVGNRAAEAAAEEWSLVCHAATFADGRLVT